MKYEGKLLGINCFSDDSVPKDTLWGFPKKQEFELFDEWKKKIIKVYNIKEHGG